MSALIGSIIVFLLVVLLHEFGHFSVAKLVGIKVNEFSVGMGPKIFQKTKGETKYSLRALPIGGYVAMEGEDEESFDPRSFNNVSVFKRMAVVLAGVTMNFILAIFCFFILFYFIGFGSNIIDTVIKDSPADAAGLTKGDKIVGVNYVRTDNLNDIVEEISKNNDKELNLNILRNNESINKKIMPKFSKEENRYIIGFSSTRQRSFFGSFSLAFKQTGDVVKAIFSVFSLIRDGKFTSDMISGPIGVISIIGQETSKGFLYLVQILAIISANLGVMNLIPIPGLDGGKFFLLIIESIRGKALSEKLEMKLTMIGYGILLTLMIYVTIFNDLGRLFK